MDPKVSRFARLQGRERQLVSTDNTKRLKHEYSIVNIHRLTQCSFSLTSNSNSQVPHCYQKNIGLARWVKRQRYQYKLMIDGHQSTMTEERVKLLEDIGFIWDSHAATWEERLNELREYKRINGDCNVPSSYEKNPKLATWIKCQRR